MAKLSAAHGAGAAIKVWARAGPAAGRGGTGRVLRMAAGLESRASLGRCGWGRGQGLNWGLDFNRICDPWGGDTTRCPHQFWGSLGGRLSADSGVMQLAVTILLSEGRGTGQVERSSRGT